MFLARVLQIMLICEREANAMTAYYILEWVECIAIIYGCLCEYLAMIEEVICVNVKVMGPASDITHTN